MPSSANSESESEMSDLFDDFLKEVSAHKDDVEYNVVEHNVVEHSNRDDGSDTMDLRCDEIMEEMPVTPGGGAGHPDITIK